MGYEPPFQRTDAIDTPCMEIAERIVAALKSEGILLRQGSARSGVWIVRE